MSTITLSRLYSLLLRRWMLHVQNIATCLIRHSTLMYSTLGGAEFAGENLALLLQQIWLPSWLAQRKCSSTAHKFKRHICREVSSADALAPLTTLCRLPLTPLLGSFLGNCQLYVSLYISVWRDTFFFWRKFKTLFAVRQNNIVC